MQILGHEGKALPRGVVAMGEVNLPSLAFSSCTVAWQGAPAGREQAHNKPPSRIEDPAHLGGSPSSSVLNRPGESISVLNVNFILVKMLNENF